MAKKRRHVASTQRASATTNREKPIDHEAIKKSLETLGAYYDRLSGEVVGIPARLERTLLLHSLVVLVVQNALMVVQSVPTTQFALLAGTVVWMTRKSFVELFLPPAPLRVGSGREIGLRILILVLGMSGLGALYYRNEIPSDTLHIVAFAAVYVCQQRRHFDFSQLCKELVLEDLGKSINLTIWTCCNEQKKEWIYDEMAFALTAATAFVHVIVLLTAKYVVLHCFGDINGAFMKTQQRGAKLLESVWQDIDRFEPDQLSVGASKKKKSKSKSHISSMKTITSGNDSSALQTNRSIFKEPRVQLALLTLVQILLLLTQLVLSALVLYSWEMTSVLMLSSSHVLWTLGQVRRKVLSRCTVRSADQKLKSE
ncbi:hypothetical protein AM587_10012643 [Phytophthora nicotianae]|uniref:Uncharacterized protein n=1 Tax=Phytophthora nicotianae TaxID=4792 RepID=A0A0W8C2B7_PHYNI|nr:hypothetical protein AM587_10012643 [Phytophthora nicotianae]